MQNNSELFKGQPKYQSNMSTFQKKINSQIQPKNFPKGQKIDLIIDVISDKVCLFVCKDDKKYENLETHFTEKDIVNLVNNSPELHPHNQNIILKYNDEAIELKNVEEFTSTKLRSPAKFDNQEENEQMELDEMYEQLSNQWPKDVLYMKEINEHHLEQTSSMIQQLQERLAEIEQMKKEQQDPDIVKIIEIKIKVFTKEYAKLQELQQFINQLEKYEQWTQLFYLKVIQNYQLHCTFIKFFQQTKRKYSAYETQRQCLERQLTMRTDDLRRYKLRKQAKDQDDCEKRIQAMIADFQSLENCSFLIDPFELLNYNFLSCDETDIYKKQIAQLEKDLQETEQLIALATEKIQTEQDSLDSYRENIGEISEERQQQHEINAKLYDELQELEQRSKEILVWRDKYNQLSKFINELQSKHSVNVQQREQHLQIKTNEIPQLKAQLENLNLQLDEFKDKENVQQIDPKSKQLQDELQKIKSSLTLTFINQFIENSEIEIKITKLQQEIQKKKEDIQYLKNESQQTQQQLNEQKVHESQVMQQLASQEVTRKQFEKIKQKNEKKKKKQMDLQDYLSNQQVLDEITRNIKLIENESLNLKQELEKLKGISNKKDSEIKNLKLRLDLNVK